MLPIPRASSALAVQPLAPSVLRQPIHGRAALLTCMHGSLECGSLARKLARDPQIVRNPGARVSDEAVRSLLLAYELFGARSWLVLQHQDCGLALLERSVTEKLWPGEHPAGTSHGWTRGDRIGSEIGRLLLADRTQLLASDLSQLRSHRLRPSDVAVHGYLLDDASGQLLEVTPE